MRWGVLGTVAVWLLVGLPPPFDAGMSAESPPPDGAGERPQTPGSSPIFQSGTDLVVLSVTVTDGKRRFVAGLSERDFLVLEDNVKQDISFFVPGYLPLDLAVLLDLSSSMLANLPTAQRAALRLVEAVRPGDRVTVVAFHDRAEVLSPLSHDIPSAVRAIRGATTHGATALYNALYVTLHELSRNRGDGTSVRRQAIVVLSDGEDNRSLIPFEDVMDAAKSSAIAIYAIGLSPRTAILATRMERFSRARFILNGLAQETGARAFFPTDTRDLNGIYGQIAEELTHQYTLGYVPTNARRDGAFRRVSAQIVDRPEMMARTRSGYRAPSPVTATASP
jgi:Ca-activated chloride channel homolog